jgi:16S rRNA (guanine527-N7)-methyltransferase
VDSPAQLPPELAATAATLFGDRLPVAEEYARRLATDGILRGLIGPREADRIWDRHLLNCVATAELIPSGAGVVDVGSGAGLPGVVLAIARPDLTVVLVEPLARRCAFLSEVVESLGLTSATVVRARADECVGTVDPAEVVVARALAPLDRLVGWCLPLVVVGGQLLAIKGTSAADEVAAHREAIRRLGGGAPTVRECGVGVLESPTVVIEVLHERVVESASSKAARFSRVQGSSRSGRPNTGPASSTRGRRRTP